MTYLIAGLGNIGPAYELSRHNAGFLALDRLGDIRHASFTNDRYGDVADFSLKGRRIYLLKPTTYMNASGKAVRYWLQKLNIPSPQLLVVVDDVALPFGTLRMRPKGASAGHNGLGDIDVTLGTQAYPRLRIGIGNNFEKGRQVDYVLGRFTDDEFKALPDILDRAADMILSFCLMGVDETMNKYNG